MGRQQLRGIGPALKALKMTHKTAAARSGVDASLISRYASGDRFITPQHAEQLAPVLKSEPFTLQFDNRRVAAEKGIAEGDVGLTFKAVESAVNITQKAGKELSPEGERALDDLLTAAEGFFDALAKKSYEPRPGEERYGYEPGRDATGRRTTVEKARERGEASIFPDFGPSQTGGTGQEKEYTPEDYLAAEDDGRDPVTGHRIAPFEYDDDEDFEDAEEYDDE